MDYKLELVLIPGPHPERENYQSFADFTDPDGNVWLLHEVDRSKG
jgi:hypothetical protein